MMDISTCFFIAKIASVGERIALYNLCKGYILHRYDYLYYNYTRCALSYPVLDTEFCENLLADIGEVMHVANNRYCTKLIFSLEDLVNNYSASVGAPPICNGHSITVMNHFMYVIGGRSDDSCYSIRKIPVYNMLTKHWSHIETTICVSDMDCSQLDKDTIDATDNSSQSQESSTPVNQFFHSASPLCHESSCNLGGRYIITLAGMVHTSTKQSDQNVFILDTFAMKWIRPLVSSEIPNSSQTNHVNSNTPANNDIPPVMCGAMVCISNLTTSARVTQLLTFGGYIAADRTITNDVHLVTVTEHPCYTSNSSGNGNGNKEGLPSGCDHSSDFSVSCQRLVNRAAGGNQFRIRSPAPVMNHSACLCYPFNGGDYVSDAISMATCAAYPTRMLIYGGISKFNVIHCGNTL